jgi:putative transposase
MTEHKQLRRLDTVWVTPAIYFVTICAKDRRPIMANFGTVDILRREFAAARERHGWRIGRFVVMPDHVHFFCISDERRDASSLSRFVGAIKEWTAKQMVAYGARPPIWQKQFFDHLLRSDESYANKWTYVHENPVRAGLVAKAEEWPHAGEIETLE